MEKEISIQCKRKEDFDSHKCVRNVEVSVGDFVKMKAPRGCADWSKFTRELQVIKCFKNAVKTHDGRIWNKSRVAVIKESHASSDNSTFKSQLGGSWVCDSGLQGSSRSTPSVHRRSIREIRKPAYLKVFVV